LRGSRKGQVELGRYVEVEVEVLFWGIVLRIGRIIHRW
jgi:hypothetical protein